MEGVKIGDYARIRGLNFQGEIQFTGNSFKLSATQFKKGALYTIDINDSILEKDCKRYLIFKKASQLFTELIDNYNMEISDEESLILPIQVNFKGQAFELKIEIPLIEKKYQSQTQRLGDLYNHIAKMNKFYLALQREKDIQKKSVNVKQLQENVSNKLNKINSELIVFKGDQSNTSYKHFQIQRNIIKLSEGNGQLHIYNHHETLPFTGIFHFKFKILRGAKPSMIVAGICGKNIKSYTTEASVTKSPYFMGYNLNKAEFIANKVTIPGGSSVYQTNKTILKVQINLNLKHVTWFMDEQPFYLAKIPKDLEDVYLYPFVMLDTQNNSIQFINHD